MGSYVESSLNRQAWAQGDPWAFIQVEIMRAGEVEVDVVRYDWSLNLF